MNRSLGLTAEMFGIGGAMFLIGYVVFDVPSNLLMVRFGARVWLTRIAITWALITAAMAFVRGPYSFYLLRFGVGAAEAGCLPGIIYFLAQWFPHTHRGRYTAAVTLAIPVGLGIAPPIAAMLVKLDGHLGLLGWQWLFLIEGAVSLALGIVCWLHLTDRPADAEWLTSAERDLMTDALAREHALQDRGDTSVWQALIDPRVAVLSLAYGCIVTQMNFSGLWIPQMLHAHGVKNALIATLTAIPFLCAAVVGPACGRQSDRSGAAFRYLLMSVSASAAGWLLSALVGSVAVLVSGIAIAVSGVFAAMALFWTLPPRLLNGSAAAAAIGLISAIGALVAAAIMPLVGQYSAKAGWPAVLVGMAGLNTVALLTLLLIRGRLSVVARARGSASAHADARSNLQSGGESLS
jgi:ACS family tartrate transporter-like MFS transporter